MQTYDVVRRTKYFSAFPFYGSEINNHLSSQVRFY